MLVEFLLEPVQRAVLRKDEEALLPVPPPKGAIPSPLLQHPTADDAGPTPLRLLLVAIKARVALPPLCIPLYGRDPLLSIGEATMSEANQENEKG